MPRRIKQTCNNCRFSTKRIGDERQRECRRNAPAAHNAFIFYLAELLRDIAWSQHYRAYSQKPDDDDDDLTKEATEANFWATWPEVDRDDWCGEWERGPK